MVYNATYDEGDIAEATLNTVVKAVITIGSLVTIIVIAWLWGSMKKGMKF